MKLKITPIGNSFGVILPKELLAKLNVASGDAVYITETPDGFSVSPYDPDFEKDMERAKGIIKKRRHMLRELAKR
ncbi:MAG: AbrB/MazE/SpoVT family DNA-binding domain-containing protein [Beijerinckiaceae bacterium]